MNASSIEEIANAILYEGYLLYPYRASAVKNRQRWNFGVLYPRAYAESQSGNDAWWCQTECLMTGGTKTKLSVRLRFLQIESVGREAEQGRERDIELRSFYPEQLAWQPTRAVFSFPCDDHGARVDAMIEITSQCISQELYKIRVIVFNNSAFAGSTRDEALRHSMVSTHTILGIDGGEFVSLLDPPAALADLTKTCKNIGIWPVLTGDEDRRDAMLCSPIILYDYPKIAPESPGALFDGTEIDEILSLRILTLTDEEKREMSLTDERTREILERTEAMTPEQFMKVHGVLHNIREGQL